MAAQDIRVAALNFLARREHSVWELKEKLAQKFLYQRADRDWGSDSGDVSDNDKGNDSHTNGENLNLGQDQFCENDIELAITALLEDNLLDDWRFTELFVSGRLRKGFGPVKIAYELRQKKVAEEIIQESLDIASETWLQYLHKIRVKKFGEAIPEDLKDKNRQYSYLYQRGYEPEQINKILQQHYG